MPRDDLSIDFNPKSITMPLGEALDPGLILDDFAYRVANLPEEIRFLQTEVTDRDVRVANCLKLIEDRDQRLQKFIKENGSHAPNPKEKQYRQEITKSFAQAEQLSNEKIALTQRLQNIIDKHLRHLDSQIRVLYDKNEPGFTDPDELPSLLRPSAANNSAPSARALNASMNPVTAALSPLTNPSIPLGPKGTNSQLRNIQTNTNTSSSAPSPPAATMMVKRAVREGSAGPGNGSIQRARSTTGQGSATLQTSGLARHSSLGPGTPKGHTATGVQRAGSAGPGRTTLKGGVVPGRKGTPSSVTGRSTKKGTPAASGGSGGGGGGGSGSGPKSGLQRVRKSANNKNSPSSTAESELSDADSVASGDESDGPLRTGGRNTPARSGGSGGGGASQNGGEGSARGDSAAAGAPSSIPRTKRDHGHHHHNHHHHDDDHMYLDDDENNDDKKYCICQKVSFGDMVACDNDDCPYEWFHWTCVGLKSEPGGKWYCPVCVEAMKDGKSAVKKEKSSK